MLGTKTGPFCIQKICDLQLSDNTSIDNKSIRKKGLIPMGQSGSELAGAAMQGLRQRLLLHAGY